METKHILIIAALIVIICLLAGAIFGVLTKNVEYKRIEIAPNATSIEVPTENAKYEGEINESGCKLWSFKQGALVSFNSEEAMDARGLTALGGAVGVKAIQELILDKCIEKKNVDGYDVYKIDGEMMDIVGRGEMYCIMTGSNATHDNIIIVTDNIDITVHMAKSIQYKTLNITTEEAVPETSEYTVSTNDNANNTNTTPQNDKQYTQQDLDDAKTEAYWQGYDDSYDDLDYDDPYSDDFDDYESSYDSRSSDSDVETFI